MLDVEPKPLLEFPDDPKKWDGWSNYKADNLYARLCLDHRAKPDDEQIQQHCAALLQWWQKKLRFKNQPSNPLAQLLGRGLDEASTHLVQARMQLLDPVRRSQIDQELAERTQQEALTDFSKFVAFSITGTALTPELEANLTEFGQRNGLTEEQTRVCIEEELQRSHGQRSAPAAPPDVAQSSAKSPRAEAESEFLRILCLSELDLGDATVLVRRIFVTVAENLGIPLERAEHLLEDFLDEEEDLEDDAPTPLRIRVQPHAPTAAVSSSVPQPAVPPVPRVHALALKAPPVRSAAGFTNPIGAPMVFVPAGEFVMGSIAADAGPDEQPLTPVTLSAFFMSRFPVTNAQYEQFDASHRQKRMLGAGDNHPVVSVTSLEAVKYCKWLAQKDGRTYRLPTEAEWEYAARGTDGRKFPWGNHDRRGHFANFADASTTFPWRDPHVSDGFPETSPVGAFPRGASFFGLEDMAGNVWEWCLDFYQPLPGTPKRNLRGAASGMKRIYRGGSWKSRFSNLRATARGSNAPNYSCNDVGFRIACEVGGESQ